MSKLQAHELAKGLGRQNKEVTETDKYNRGKEHIAKLDTPKTEEKVVTANLEGEKAETPKKKKNISKTSCDKNSRNSVSASDNFGPCRCRQQRLPPGRWPEPSGWPFPG